MSFCLSYVLDLLGGHAEGEEAEGLDGQCKYHATLIKPVAKGILKGLHSVKDEKNGKETSPQDVFLAFP